MQQIPSHLQKYIVEQDYQKYTALDHAVWRYVLRQLKNFLSVNAHQCYLDGLLKTGIEIEQIPRIENVSQHLQKFGWTALPVSGFIPPAAFMELQSLSILPIASDMRSIEHLLYTPAPDIVHEAAGHAPIIADLEYAAYLKQYAQVAKKAIISREDLVLYKAIRELSDIKENPNSTSQETAEAEAALNRIANSVSFVSEATQLSRMNWWTAEYGLVGPIKAPKIFGAGLLSSVGESKWCLSDKVKKIPLSIDCVKQSYDITEPQPQLFVAEDFKHLSRVLEELSETMSYKVGGEHGLEQARKAESVNTVEFENGLQISGVLNKYHTDSDANISYLQFLGPTQLCFKDQELKGHDNKYHSQGYGTPVGEILNFNKDQLEIGQKTELNYKSGVKVSGVLSDIFKISDTACILSFIEATCEYKNEKLFLPEWGTYDIVLAQKVTSVFGGPADRISFGTTDDFMAHRVETPVYSDEQKNIFLCYQDIRHLRTSTVATEESFIKLFEQFIENAPLEWLLFVELIEIAIKLNFNKSFIFKIENHLAHLSQKNKAHRPLISEGLRLAHDKY
jgi:phenylalanine-4-hydroxylase